MNWEAIGAVGEVVGGVTVLATLVYLAIQVRQSTAASRFAATATVHNNFNHASSHFSAGGNETMVAHHAMTSLEGLTAQETFRFGAQLYNMYCHFDMVYHLHLKDLIQEDEFIRAVLLFRWFHQMPGPRSWWEGNIYDERAIRTGDLFSVEFRDFVSVFEATGRLPLPERYAHLQDGSG